MMSTAIQGVRLQVPPEKADEARALLAQLTGLPADADVGVPIDDDAIIDDYESSCPACGSESFGATETRRRLKAITLLFPTLILLWPVTWGFSRWRCEACGHRW